MLLNEQLQIIRSTLKQIVRSVLRPLGCIFWLVWPENLRPCVSGTLKTHNSRTVANWTHVCVYDVFDSEPALELNPEVATLIPGTPV